MVLVAQTAIRFLTFLTLLWSPVRSTLVLFSNECSLQTLPFTLAVLLLISVLL